jgi:hypothetical protein
MTDATQTETEPAVEPSRYTLLSNEPAIDEPIPAQEEVKQVAPEPDANGETEPDEPEERTEKPKRDAQERIRKLAAERKEALERAERAEAALAAKAIPPETKPNPADYVGGRFNDDYQDALDAWRDAQTEQRIAQAIAERERQSSVEATKSIIQEHEKAFRETHQDYDDAIAKSGVLFDDPITVSAITEIDNITEIAYMIGKDDALLEQLARMTPTQRLIKIGALSVANQQPPVKTVRVSQAAKPITPVSGGSAALTGTAAIEAAEKAMDYDAWKAAKKAAGK